MHPLLLAISLCEQLAEILAERGPMPWEVLLIYNQFAVNAIERSRLTGALYGRYLLGEYVEYP